MVKESWQSKNCRITSDGWNWKVDIKKKYEKSMLLYFVFMTGFIYGMLYLIHVVKDQKEPESANFFLVMNLIFISIGSILTIAMIYELLKSEVIVFNPDNFMLKEKVLGLSIVNRKYEWYNIKNVGEAPPPQRGWRVTRHYNNAFHYNKEYTNDIRKVYPTLQFLYKDRTIQCANGLDPDETKKLIDLIRRNDYRRCSERFLNR